MLGVLKLSHGSNPTLRIVTYVIVLLVCLLWCFIYIVPKLGLQHLRFEKDFGHVVVSACLQLLCFSLSFAVRDH